LFHSLKNNLALAGSLGVVVAELGWEQRVLRRYDEIFYFYLLLIFFYIED
jgi:hypothetical protein